MTTPFAVTQRGVIALALAAAAVLCAGIAMTGRAQTAADAPGSAGCVDISAHGADRRGARDTAAAFRAAAAAGDADAVCLYFPSGNYRFSSTPAIVLRAGAAHREAAVTLKGDGAGLSRLLFDAGVGGPAIRLNGPRQSFHIRDLSLLAGGRSKADGLSIVQEGASDPNPAQSDISGVSIHGQDGFGAGDRFARGVYLHQVSNVNLTSTTIAGSADGAPYASQGTCLYIEGTRAAVAIQVNIVASQINHCGRGIIYGAYVQGLQIIGSNFVGNGAAIVQPPGNFGNDQLAVTGSQFNSGARNIWLSAPIDGVTITGNDFYLSQAGSASIDTPGVQFTIGGNSFIQLGTPSATAIAVGAFMLDAGVITGNSFKNFNTAVLLQPGSSRVNVQSNAYSGITSQKVADRGAGNAVGGGSL